MPWPSDKIPKLRPHSSGRAIATFGGVDHYFGKFGTPESQDKYRQFLAEWLANDRRPVAKRPGGPTVNELILKYLDFAEGYYRKADQVTNEVWAIKASLKPLREIYGRTLVSEFGPLPLKAVRDRFLEAGLARTEVNRRTRHVTRCFRWGVAEGIVPALVLEGLRAVPGLKRGRGNYRETEPIVPVHDSHVDAVLAHVSRQVRAMIELQRLTGMRPGEVVIMRTCDLETSGRVWVYSPERHKTEHHERNRPIYLGPKAQEILKPWLRKGLTEYLFQPKEADEERKARMRAARRTKVQPSQSRRSKAEPRKKPGTHYSSGSYRQAVIRACDRLGIPHWHPNQLRHNAATRFRREFGLDVAQLLLGHASADTTEIYAELDTMKAMAAAEKAG